jgi:hypothetical protein
LPQLLSSSPQLPPSANQPLAVSKYQDVNFSEEEALMVGLEASQLDAENTLPPSGSTSYSSSSRVSVLMTVERWPDSVWRLPEGSVVRKAGNNE